MDTEFINQLNAVQVNTKEAIHRFSGNSGLYEKFLVKFLQDDNFTKMAQSMQHKDYDTLLIAAHTLKGIAGNLSIQPLYQTCSELVTQLRAGQTDNCEQIFEKIKENYYAVYHVISEREKVRS